jgi:hypothetical protein
VAKKNNIIFIFISVLPVVALLIFYGQLRNSANTQIFGSHRMIISKTGFVSLITGLSVVSYFISDYVSFRLAAATFMVSQPVARSLINIAFSFLSILLILSNR